jgi:hypothetical protein
MKHQVKGAPEGTPFTFTSNLATEDRTAAPSASHLRVTKSHFVRRLSVSYPNLPTAHRRGILWAKDKGGLGMDTSNSARVLVKQNALQWLDLEEDASKQRVLSTFRNNVLIFENEVDIIGQHLEYWMNFAATYRGTIKELLEPQNEHALLLITSTILLTEARESLQAARRLLLCGYTGRMLSCLRSAIEALRYADICGSNGKEARKWFLSSGKVSEPDTFQLHPVVNKLMKLHSTLSERGVHPRNLARLTSAIGKRAPSWFKHEKSEEFQRLSEAGISEFTRLAIVVSWGFLEYITQKLFIKDIPGYDKKRTQDMLVFLRKEFGQFGAAIDEYVRKTKMANKDQRMVFGFP